MKIDVLENSIADHQPLPDKIADFIREAIIVGKLQPGEKISEAKLAEELRISRTPIREAIRMLESEGFVAIIPHAVPTHLITDNQNDIGTFHDPLDLMLLTNITRF